MTILFTHKHQRNPIITIASLSSLYGNLLSYHYNYRIVTKA